MTIDEQLDAFVEAHPNGWSHEEWLELLSRIEEEGGDVGDREALGLRLENARLAAELQRRKVPGMGPKRIESVVDRFQTLWSFRHASPEEIAEIPTIHLGLAEKVAEAFRDA